MAAEYQVDAEQLCRGIHFIINRGMLHIECSYCDETGSVFHSGETFDASLGGTWIAVATAHLIDHHPREMGLIGV